MHLSGLTNPNLLIPTLNPNPCPYTCLGGPGGWTSQYRSQMITVERIVLKHGCATSWSADICMFSTNGRACSGETVRRRRPPTVMPRIPCVSPAQTPGTGSPPTRRIAGLLTPCPASRYRCGPRKTPSRPHWKADIVFPFTHPTSSQMIWYQIFVCQISHVHKNCYDELYSNINISKTDSTVAHPNQHGSG